MVPRAGSLEHKVNNNNNSGYVSSCLTPGVVCFTTKLTINSILQMRELIPERLITLPETELMGGKTRILN